MLMLMLHRQVVSQGSARFVGDGLHLGSVGSRGGRCGRRPVVAVAVAPLLPPLADRRVVAFVARRRMRGGVAQVALQSDRVARRRIVLRWHGRRRSGRSEFTQRAVDYGHEFATGLARCFVAGTRLRRCGMAAGAGQHRHSTAGHGFNAPAASRQPRIADGRRCRHADRLYLKIPIARHNSLSSR